MPRTDHLQPPVRRVLAVDAGSRGLRLVLVKSSFGQVELLRQETFDLHEEGLLAAEELKAHLQKIRDDCGDPPVALTLPQHLSISQIIDLPQSPEAEVRKTIEDETLKLTGVSDSAIVHDFVRVTSPVPGRQQFWVTFCKQDDIEERIRQLGVDQDDLCEVTTTASALLVAYRAAAPQVANAILVHLGAQSTVLVVLSGGQAVFATSFPVGGDSFTRAIAKARQCSIEEAESLHRKTNLLSGEASLPQFAELVDGWAAELKRQIHDCFASRRDKAGLSAFTQVASGTAFSQPGLLEYLASRAGLSLRPWPVGAGLPAPGFEIAHGTALQALGLATQSVSLLPPARRAAWRRRLTTQLIEFASVALLVIGFLALIFGIWQKVTVLQRRELLLAKAQAALESLQSNQALTSVLLSEYERLRPLLERQQNTTDTLGTLALLQQSRSNRSFWFVLMADQQSYFSAPATNRPGRTNPAAGPAGRELESLFTATGPESSPAKPGLIAELCVPEDSEGARRVLSQIVNDLKERPLFNKVDLVSDDLRRYLADPKVILPERHFALSLDFAATEFTPPPTGRRPRLADAGGTSAKPARRPATDGSEPGATTSNP
jgi:Tfp pilus assembly PilM family ATPase